MPGTEPALLLLVAHREPVLAQQDPLLDQHALEHRALVEEPAVLVRGAEAHHPLDACAVVPGPVEENDLARRGQVIDVPLEVPLRALAFGRDRQGDDPGDPGVEELRDPFDRAALARGVTALEDDDDTLPGRLHPLLDGDELLLQALQLGLVPFAGESPGGAIRPLRVAFSIFCTFCPMLRGGLAGHAGFLRLFGLVMMWFAVGPVRVLIRRRHRRFRGQLIARHFPTSPPPVTLRKRLRPTGRRVTRRDDALLLSASGSGRRLGRTAVEARWSRPGGLGSHRVTSTVRHPSGRSEPTVRRPCADLQWRYS